MLDSGATAVLIASGNWVCLFITNRVWQALGSLDISQYVVCVVSEVSIFSVCNARTDAHVGLSEC